MLTANLTVLNGSRNIYGSSMQHVELPLIDCIADCKLTKSLQKEVQKEVIPMNANDLLTLGLGLTAPWKVVASVGREQNAE